MTSGLDFLGFGVIAAVLVGLRLQNNPKSAALGNGIGALALLIAVTALLLREGLITHSVLWAALLAGCLLGGTLALKVAMIQMPQLVALLNGFGGAASALVVLAALPNTPSAQGAFIAGGFALAIGSLTLGGSIIAALKLDQRLPQRPLVLPGHSIASLLLLASIVTAIVLLAAGAQAMNMYAALLITGLAAILGAATAVRVGGADMPITISLLNSLSGLASSLAGFVLANPLLVAVGAIVGAAGFILTQIMCRGMNRGLLTIILGRTSVAEPRPTYSHDQTADESGSYEAAERLLQEANSVAIIPGYGMALAQAQFELKTLVDLLEDTGKQVQIIIHPTAGRMPGHMNVLLAEANIPYEKLVTLEDAGSLADVDVALIVGANDVVNPAALETNTGPISGMPIVRIDEAAHIIVMNLDTLPGYSGVPNPMYKWNKTTLLLGDAQESLQAIRRTWQSDDSDAEDVRAATELLLSAKQVAIIPGYGMALAQAQFKVKELFDTLTQKGCKVFIAVHPVAGRMPGHMNVLLAEADIGYDVLLAMDEANEHLPATDVAVIIGANDVVNPASLTEEGTPIFGMPILRADLAAWRIICNLDTHPGYSGVPNPLYQQDNTLLLVGDAAASVRKLTDRIKQEPTAPSSEQ